jgi:Zn-dependent peptidase ImmA (M78 family)
MVNPASLKWARESSGLSIEVAAARAGIANPSILAEAERGERNISFRQLSKLAHYVRLPLRVLYQDDLPADDPRPIDFRRRTSEPVTSMDFELVRALREVKYRVEAVDKLEESLGLARPQLPVTDVSDNAIRKLLTPLVCVAKWDRNLLKAQRHWPKTDSEFLARTKAIVEDRFALFAFETTLDGDIFRGCSLPETRTPVVLLNSYDGPLARRFTLVHEIIHLLMRQAGICNPPTTNQNEVELRCDRLAGESLMPEELLRPIIDRAIGRTPEQLAEVIRRAFKVSSSAAAVRLRQLELISIRVMVGLLTIFKEQWLQHRKGLKERASGGPHAYETRVRHLGPTFTSLVLAGLDRQALSITSAAGLLGVSSSYQSIADLREKNALIYG